MIQITPCVMIYKLINSYQMIPNASFINHNIMHSNMYVDIITVTSILNSTMFCLDSTKLTNEFCESFDADKCSILQINDNRCYKNICLCAHQDIAKLASVVIEIKHNCNLLNETLWPSWVLNLIIHEDDDLAPMSLIVVSICFALCGLCVVLTGIEFYHRYFGYHVLKKEDIAGADPTIQQLLK